MFKLPQKIKDDISKYRDNLEKFIKGEIKEAFFRGIRVPWGNYSQRGGKVLMSRLRIPSGILLSEQLKAIAYASKNFADSNLHITTRQDIQIHNVSYQNSIKIIEYLKDFNISPRGGGGNTVRNITGCYLSGICPYEKYEVYKLVCSLSEYLLTLDESYNLPRKFKIAFSACQKDCAMTGINDVGFVATNGNFKVIVGGGMGAKSAVGKVLEENIEEQDIGYIVKSVINVYNKYGDRKNKHHNRLRFLIEDTGWERFKELYFSELTKVKETEYIALRTENGLPELSTEKSWSEIQTISSSDQELKLFYKYNTGKQKQIGYYYIELRIPFGEITSDILIGLSELDEILPEIIFRTNQRQNLIISNVRQDKINIIYQKIKKIMKDYLFPQTVLDIVSCKAASTCNLGICNTISMAPEIVKELEKINPDLDKLKDVRINLNGCPNSCGQHPIGTISLSGLARKVYNRTVPFYKVYSGGKIDVEKTLLSQEIGVIPARVVPKFIAEFISEIQKNMDSNLYQYLSDKGKIFLKELIKKYSFVPTYEEDKNYYIDFGKQEDFSLSGLGQSECGAGVIDMIESDLESAKQSLIKAEEKNFDLLELRNALIYSCRSLLVVKGVDPKDEKESVNTFVEKFVKTGITKKEFENLGDVYNSILSEKVSNKQLYSFIKKFYDEVKEIYSTMDSNFNFGVRSQLSTLHIEEKTKEQQVISTQNISFVYDLRGTPCPMNYVKTKIKLEELKIGDILEVYLDDGEPIQNVPKSLENDGQEVLKIQQEGVFFKVFVKKKI